MEFTQEAMDNCEVSIAKYKTKCMFTDLMIYPGDACLKDKVYGFLYHISCNIPKKERRLKLIKSVQK